MYEQGMKIAIDALAAKGVLSDFNVILDFFDEQCDHALGIRLTVELLNKAKTSNTNMVPIIIGPTCAEILFIQQYVKEYDFVYVNHNALGVDSNFNN